MRRGIGVLAASVALLVFVGIAAGSSAPLVTAGLDQDVVMGDTVYLDGYGTHVPDGELAEIRWSIETPEGSTITPECVDCEQTSFQPNATGEYAVTLTAQSAAGVERADRLFVTVDTRAVASTGGGGADDDSCFVSNTGGDDEGTNTMDSDVCGHHGMALGYEWINRERNLKGLRFENEGLADQYSEVYYNPDGTVTVPINVYDNEIQNLFSQLQNQDRTRSAVLAQRNSDSGDGGVVSAMAYDKNENSGDNDGSGYSGALL